MNKNLYKLGMFFLGLTAACGLLQSLISFTIGPGVYTLDSFIAWFIATILISNVVSIFLIKYFYNCKYWFAFYTSTIALVVNLCYAVAVFKILVSGTPLTYFKQVIMAYLCAGILFAVSLIFSGNREKFWLKMAGVYMLVIGFILLSTIIGGTSVQPGTLEKITQWTSLASNLIPVLLIMHFITEIKLLKTEDPESEIIDDKTNKLYVVKIIACMIIIPLAILLTYQCAMQVYWANRNFESTKALARLFEARMYVNGKGDTLRYRLLKPLSYDPKKQYPLMISLPYGGQPGTDTIRQLEGAAAAQILSADSNRIKYPAFIFVPNCPAGSGWGGIPNHPSADTLVYKAITALDTMFSIDTKRRYVTGISRGGYGSWHFICTRPDIFAAAIPVCGGDDPKMASKIVNVSVWAFHGAKDHNVPVSNSRGMIEGMKKAGLKPQYTEYPNQGHNIWYQVSITPGLWDWLFAQQRN